MKNKLFAALTALVFSFSCAHAPVNPKGKLRDTCLNRLLDAKKIAIQNKDGKKMVEFWQDHWCNDYNRLGEDITELGDYIVK